MRKITTGGQPVLKAIAHQYFMLAKRPIKARLPARLRREALLSTLSATSSPRGRTAKPRAKSPNSNSSSGKTYDRAKIDPLQARLVSAT